MKTITIFLASSEELVDERIKFGDFIRQLDDTYEIRGYRIKLIKWEDLPSGDDGRPKQEEYNEKVRESDMFVGLFHTKAGQFTLEEYETAKKAQQENGSPTLYVFCRELTEGEQEDASLTEFKKKLLVDIRHYWNKYNNSDSLQLQFVMQLLKVENNHWRELKVENGNVFLGNLEIAKMDNLRFAAENDEYVKTQKEIFELGDEISGMQKNLVKKQQKLERKKAKWDENPDDEDCREDYEDLKEEVDRLIRELQKKLDRINKLKEDFGQYQIMLFNVAKRVAQLQGERISERMRRAMDAFNDGRISEANTILNEAEADAKRDFEDFKQSKEITEQKRQSLINSIKELQLKADTVLADTDVPIELRIEHVSRIYEQADEIAQEIDYDQESYFELLWHYKDFLFMYGKYKEALKVLKRLSVLSLELYGEEDSATALIFSYLSQCFSIIGKPDEVLEYAYKALEVIEKVKDHSSYTALIYIVIANSFMAIEKNEEAFACYNSVLEMGEIELEPEIEIAVYNGIGSYCFNNGDYEKALEYFKKSFSSDGYDLHLDVLKHKQLGETNYVLGKEDEAVEQFQKAIKIAEKEFGQRSVLLASLYRDIAKIYEGKEALDYGMKALDICLESLGSESALASSIYAIIGGAYNDLKDYNEALCHYQLALDYFKRMKIEDCSVATIINRIGEVCQDLDEYKDALSYYMQALAIVKRLKIVDLSTAMIIHNIGDAYCDLEEYNEALKYYKRALAIHKKMGTENTSTAIYNDSVGFALYNLEEFKESIKYRKRALAIYKRLGIEDKTTARINNSIGVNYSSLGEYKEALKYFKTALEILKRLGIENWLAASINYNISGALSGLGEKKERLKYFKEAMAIWERTGDERITPELYNTLGLECYPFARE